MEENWQNIEPSWYAKLLESDEWLEKRNYIVKRDSNVCQRCQNISYLNNEEFTLMLGKLKKTPKGFFLILETQEQDIPRKIDNSDNLIINKAYFSIVTNNNPVEINNHQIISIFSIDSTNLKAKNLIKDILVNSNYKKSVFLKDKLQNFIGENLNSIIWKMTKYLNVHHEFYQIGKKPWEYKNDSLVTVCQPCHKKIHQEEVIYLRDEKGNKIELIVCDRCFGTGVLHQFHHVENGICFKCKGNRFIQKLI